MSETALLCLARERFRAATEMLGTGKPEGVLDESIDGARVLAKEARGLLTGLLEIRLRASR